ncbi:MAG TPA: response regulator [Hyphomonadaceae bacterium]|jgi:CheY-like chemotaxis protein
MAAGGNAQTVLVLDDNRFQQQVLRMILMGLGVKDVVTAKDVDAALQVLAEKKFDLVIADYRLDGKSGADFTRLVRAARGAGDRFIPIIACTSDTMPEVIRELRDAGADEILGKPVSSQALAAKIDAVINARRRFVSSSDFFGPDRRRQSRGPGAGAERRGSR